MSRLFFRGDTHGDFSWLPDWCKINQTSINDVLVILGDAGLNFRGERNERENYVKAEIAKQPITLLCVRGNHEARPTQYRSMHMTNSKSNITCGPNDWLWVQESYPNIFYAKDGGVYTINNKKILTIGGAYSIDKWYRIDHHLTWFKNEQLSETERKNIMRKIRWQHYDYVLTHTCPFSWMPTWLFLPGIDQNTVDNTMEIWFEQVKDKITYGRWFFGHYHDNHKYDDDGIAAEMLFEKITEIK